MWLLWEAVGTLGLKEVWPRRTVTPELRGVVVGAFSWGSQFWGKKPSAGVSVPTLKVEGGKWHQKALLSLESYLCECHVSQLHSKKSKLSLPHGPQAFRSCCLPWVVCLPFLQEWGGTLRALFHPNLLTFKTPVFEPTGWKKNRKNHPFSFSQPVVLGKCYPVHSTVCLSLSCLSLWQGSLPSAIPVISFFLKPCLHTSYLTGCGFFSPSISWVFRIIWQLSLCVLETRQA